MAFRHLFKARWLLLAIAILNPASSAQLPRVDKAKAALETPWQEMAQEAGLPPASIVQLGREKVLMTDDELFQSFEAYLHPAYRKAQGNASEIPYFITTDAVFQAYAWCLQKAISNIEESHADSLPEVLRTTLLSLATIEQRIKGDATLIQQSKARAQFVTGVAAALMNVDVQPLLQDQDLKDGIEHEVTRIRLALGTGIPARLKLPKGAFLPLDYTVFKPVGIYSGDSVLSAYFHAIRWLQMAPFRTDSDEDMLAAEMLTLALGPNRLEELKLDPKAHDWFYDFSRLMEDLAGPPDQITIELSERIYDHLQTTPKTAAATLIGNARENGRIAAQRPNNKLTTTSTLSPAAGTPPCVYLIAGVRLLDAQWLEELSSLHGTKYFPNALSIASNLGSPYAQELENADAKTVSLRDAAREGLKDNSSLHTQTLALLQRLFEPMPPDAPAFMKTKAWAAKSCQTALSAWVQSRHVWALQARPQYSTSSGTPDWPAFVEPLPDFFSGFAELCQTLDGTLARREQASPNLSRAAKHLRHMADTTDPVTAHAVYLSAFELLMDAGVPYPKSMDDQARINAELIRHLRQNADWIERGEADNRHPVAQNLLKRLSAKKTPPLKYLETICLRLAVLAHKQMRGQKPRPEESKWLNYFGRTLAAFTDCGSGPPLDDVPKAIRIFTNPTLNKALTAGIGRPRYLYVLYPWEGREILCRGAVLPYLERHDMTPLTDEEWRDSLHHPEHAPMEGEWLKPLLSE